MTILIIIAVLAAIGGFYAIFTEVRSICEETDDHSETHPLYDDMRLGRMRDAADDLLPDQRKPDGGA